MSDTPSSTLDTLLQRPMGSLIELLRHHADTRPDHPALIEGDTRLGYGEFVALIDRAQAALQAQGLREGDLIALCGLNTSNYAVAFAAALGAGLGVVPLPPSATPEALRLMLDDSGARLLFVDEAGQHAQGQIPGIALEGAIPDTTPWNEWLTQGRMPAFDVPAHPDGIFNVIYSSGTTGTPKGIVHTHTMRWPQIASAALNVYRPDSITLVSTPLYSNTTLVSFLPAMGGGGTTILMRKFDEARFLALSQQHRVTHTMLVPVQYRRLLAHADFDHTDLSSYRTKFCTSAPFSAALKAEVLRRWPGGLVEFFGMTEGGGSCMLLAHEHPDKLHTVGQPMPGHDIRVIDEQGKELPSGQTGEIVGHSYAQMRGYLNAPEKSRQTLWHDTQGRPFIRTGDMGRFDADGFLILMDRAKDMVISGGFNLYPSDIEAVLSQHPEVEEVAVFGVPSEQWGETPVAAVVARAGTQPEADALRAWANARMSKMQRLHAVRMYQSLPRNAMGKISKRDLREEFGAA